MNVTMYIPRQMANARREFDAVVKDLTAEQFNWCPPGKINPISAIFVHILSGEDFFIQAILQGKPRLWEAQDWGKRIGVPEPPGPGHGWEVFRCTQLALAPVLEYAQVIRAATDVYLAGLTEAELDREVNFVGRMMPAAELLMTLIVHIASHTGEIAELKGMQGVQGLPI